MRLLKAIIENFLIIEKANVLLDKQGLVLVLGYNNDGGRSDSNGVGKSSIFEAICWCLYGQTYKGLKFDDVVSNTSTGGTKVEVELEVGKDKLLITRYRNHIKHKNKLHIAVNGKSMTPFKQTDAELLLKSLLPLSLTAFKHVVYFGQGMKDKFLALGDPDKKRLLEEILGLDVFTAAEKKIKAKIKEIRDQLNVVSGVQEAQLATMNSYKERLKKFKEERNEALATLQAEEEEIEERKRLTILEKEKAISRLKKVRKDEKSLTERFEEVKSTVAEMSKKARSLEFEIVELEAKRTEILTKMKKISKLSICKECEQQVPESHVDKCIDLLSADLNEVSELIDEKEHDLHEVSWNMSGPKTEVQDIYEKLQKADSRVWEVEVSRLSGLVKMDNEVLEGLKARRIALQRPSKSLREALAEARSNYEGALKKEREIGSELPYLDYWEKGFSTSGIRAMLLDDIITFLNSRINHHSRAISDGEIAITLSPQTSLKSGKIREKMNVSASTGGAGYKAASGGQQRRMDLAVHFALSDLTSMVTGHKINILICDEILDCVDETGTDAILEMLRSKTDRGLSVFLIAHSDALKNSVESTLIVTRDSGTSTVVKG